MLEGFPSTVNLCVFCVKGVFVCFSLCVKGVSLEFQATLLVVWIGGLGIDTPGWFFFSIQYRGFPLNHSWFGLAAWGCETAVPSNRVTLSWWLGLVFWGFEPPGVSMTLNKWGH